MLSEASSPLTTLFGGMVETPTTSNFISCWFCLLSSAYDDELSSPLLNWTPSSLNGVGRMEELANVFLKCNKMPSFWKHLHHHHIVIINWDANGGSNRSNRILSECCCKIFWMVSFFINEYISWHSTKYFFTIDSTWSSNKPPTS